MAFTTQPEHYQAWALANMTYLNNMNDAGIVEILTKTERGDAIWKYPKLAALDTVMTTENVVTTSFNPTPDGLADYEEWMPVLHRHAAVVVYDINKTDKGIDPFMELKPQAPGVIWKNIQATQRALLTGLFTTAGCLVATHQKDDSLSDITSELILSAPTDLLGEVGLTFNKVMMHSSQYLKIKSDIESRLTTLEGSNSIVGRYLANMQVIINDTICAAIGNTYPTYVLSGSPFKLGWEKTITFEDERLAINAKTYNHIWYDYALGMEGCSYGGAVNPANTVIDDAASWTKVAADTNTRIVQILTKK